MKKLTLILMVALLGARAWATEIDITPGTLGPVDTDGDYFDVIAAPDITWSDAEVDALTYYYNDGTQNLEGHLATVLDAETDTFVGDAVQAVGAGEFWLGGYQNPITELVATAGWTWVNDDGTFPGVNGALGFTQTYSNWNGGEPNDAGGPGSEQYLGINEGRLGGFNDEGNLSLIGGYVVEFDPTTDPTGGLASAPDAASTAQLLGGALMLVGFASRRRRQ
jgi:hypothetical protein